MAQLNIVKRYYLTFLYCLPVIISFAVWLWPYHIRLQDIANDINVDYKPMNSHDKLDGASAPDRAASAGAGNKACYLIYVNGCGAVLSKGPASDAASIKAPADGGARGDGRVQADAASNAGVDPRVCEYRNKIALDEGINIGARVRDRMAQLGKTGGAATSGPGRVSKIEVCKATGVNPVKFIDRLKDETNDVLLHIFAYNSVAVAILVLLPYFLMGGLLASSERIRLTYGQRAERATNNGWLKFILGIVMGVGWLYILNPLGRGGSTYHQFFISVGIETANTLPIYIQANDMTPVMAGFLGWYLHMIGYVFTKLLHHDVISSRMYNMLFKKFIVTYGIALVLPDSTLVGEGQNVVFLAFVIGLFPLSAMSVLIEFVSKVGGGQDQPRGSLSQLPGISRWQILRLEEEGLDSMATLANVRPRTVKENLQVIERLAFFWVDIAQLYTIVGQDCYSKLKSYCLTASEFIGKAADPAFAAAVAEVDGVGDPREIARLLTRTFSGKLVDQQHLDAE